MKNSTLNTLTKRFLLPFGVVTSLGGAIAGREVIQISDHISYALNAIEPDRKDTCRLNETTIKVGHYQTNGPEIPTGSITTSPEILIETGDTTVTITHDTNWKAKAAIWIATMSTMTPEELTIDIQTKAEAIQRKCWSLQRH